MSTIGQAIRWLSSHQEQGLVIATVDAVDKEARTIDCTPIDEGAPLLACNLQAVHNLATGLYMVPKVGSTVVVLVSDNAPHLVVCYSEVEEVYVHLGETSVSVVDSEININKVTININGGELGGMVIVEHLVGALNGIKQDLNNLKNGIKSWTPIAQDGGAALKGSLSAWAARQIADIRREDLEDDKFKH